MTEELYSIPMALMDILPNIAFLVGAFFLVRLVLRERGTKCGRMMMLGSLLVFLGGALKATWKLLVAAEVANITFLSEQQFVLVGIGFVGVLVSIILLAREKSAKRNEGSSPAAPLMAMAAWKIPFLAVMTLASLGAQGILVYISFRRGLRMAAIFFIVAVLCMLGMAGMASGEQTISRQWIEQSINLVGQCCFAAGAFILYKKSEEKAVRC